MPSKPRPGVKGVYVELPEGLLALLERRAAQDRRTLKTTVVLAVEQYYLLFAPVAKAHEPRQFDPTVAANQDTEDGYYDCQSWWYQDEGTKVWHVNTFSR